MLYKTSSGKWAYQHNIDQIRPGSVRRWVSKDVPDKRNSQRAKPRNREQRTGAEREI